MNAGAFRFKRQTARTYSNVRVTVAHSHELHVDARNRVIKLWLHQFKREFVIQ